jgi:hypothetical protein
MTSKLALLVLLATIATTSAACASMQLGEVQDRTMDPGAPRPGQPGGIGR